jgi:uncharacterized membrane protein YeaQ/YmgE (transglycosylase-associated protein family)
MVLDRSLQRLWADDAWRHALVGGLASVPVTTLLYWQSTNELGLGPVFLGGLVAGYLHGSTGSRRVGARAGIVGALPALLLFGEVLSMLPGLSGPPWFLAAGGAMVVAGGVAFVALAAALSALVGVVGASVGGWLAGRTGRRRPPAAGS